MNKAFRATSQIPGRIGRFHYPHTFNNTNNKFNKLFGALKPAWEIKVTISEHGELKPGDAAPQAYTGTVREFPEWYKPYYLNYRRDGVFLTVFGLVGLCIVLFYL